MCALKIVVAAEPPETTSHRTIRRHLRHHFRFTYRRGLLFSRGGPARLRRRQTFLSAFARTDTSALDCPVPPVRRVSIATADPLFLRMEETKHPGPGRIDRLFLWQKNLARRDGRRRLDDSSRRNLYQRAHFDDGIAPDPSCPRNGLGHSQWRGLFSRVAIAPRNAPRRYQGSVGD